MIRAEQLLDLSFSERSKKGAKEILSGNLLYKVGILSRTRDFVKVKAVCLRVTQPKKTVEIEVIIREDEVKAKCSCPAGADGLCKHSVAVMLQLTR